MKYFYVISNLSKDYVLDVQDEVQSCLEKRGAVCRYMTDYERMKNGRHTPGEYVPEDTQCIITIGGDGTLIQAARDLAGRNIPMLGINRGHLGFLNQVDRTEDIDAAMDALVNERFRLEHRMMLRGTVFHEGKPVFQDIALNEIIATSAEHLRVLRYDLAVKGLVTFDGDTSQKTGPGDYLIVERSHMETVMVKLKQISFMQNLSNYLGNV